MSKHSKYKNTGILFELLVRQITSDTLSGKNSKAAKILETFFGSGTELSKEYRLYQSILQDKFKDEKNAERLIEAALDNRKKIKNDKLQKEKYQLIRTIIDHYSAEEFFKSRVNNYKELASINKLFDTAIGRTIPPSDIVNAKCTLIEHITNKKPNRVVVESKVLEDYTKLDKDVRLLAYKVLVDKFNDKYSVLDKKQKNLLREYINSVSDTTTLRDYINKEIPLLVQQLEKNIKLCNDDITKIKLQEVSKQLPNYLKGNIIKEHHILTLMRYYALINELNTTHGKKN